MTDSSPVWIEPSSLPQATVGWNRSAVEDDMLPVVEVPIPTLIRLLTLKQSKYLLRKIGRRLRKCKTTHERRELLELSDLLLLQAWQLSH